MKERKAFNFYKSYYDVFKELNDKDKLSFINALFEKQFEGIEPENLNGMAKFAYISQKSNIDSQVKGWEDKTGCKLSISAPTEPPSQGVSVAPTEPPTQQEKEKEKEKEKEEYSYTIEREVLNSVANLFDKKYYDTEIKKQKWLDEIRKLIQIDNEYKQTIIDVIKFARNDEFWQSNLLSISTIRKKNKSDITKFDQIKAKMPNQQKQKSAFENW